MRLIFRDFGRLLVIIALLACAGCASLPRDAFTALDQGAATVPGYNAIRIWADAPPRDIARFLGRAALTPNASRDINYLALSGGGAGGAFSAGLLNGWSATGQRPVFDIVSGVSTGALIAPFAFLGTSQDGVLRTLYTDGASTDLAALSMTRILAGSGLLDPGPLRRLIERFATAELLNQIAVEHRRGRRLLVVTTNLDAQRPVLWDMGAIAASGRPDALALFRDIMMASASIPAVYPPVLIGAQTGASAFREMHVDGGTSLQVFGSPDLLVAGQPGLSRALRRKVHLWLVVNNTLPPEFAVTGSAIMPIATRAFATFMKSQTKAIVTADAEAAARLGIDFHLAYIDRAVDYDPKTPFQSAYMTTVYALGAKAVQDGTVWKDSLAATSEWAQK